MLRAVLLVALLALAGCAAPTDPTVPLLPSPTATPAGTSPPPTPPAAPSPVATTPATPPPEPVALPDGDRTFELSLGAGDDADRLFLVNATQRVHVTLFVRNAEPAERGFGATALAWGPNGTRQQDTGVVPDGGAAFVLRLAPLGLAPGEGPALVGVRVSATVPVVVEGRMAVDGEVPAEGGSTVP